MVWRVKDWIDRRFMSRFSEFPPMAGAQPKGLLSEFDEQMQCGGCGSKVSAELLDEVLNDLGNQARDDAAEYVVPKGKILLHSVIISVLWRILIFSPKLPLPMR